MLVMMTEVLPSVCGQKVEEGLMGMPQFWAPPDERDAYIGWLKSEFAAANALIDSMCEHMCSIGGPGEYDRVFGSLNRRRHAWTPSLYLQHFFSVAEVVTALQEVARKRHRASAAPKDRLAYTSGALAEEDEPRDSSQLGAISTEESNPFLNLSANNIAKSQHREHAEIECFSKKNKDVINGSHIKTTPETGDIETSHSPSRKSALSTSAKTSMTEFYEKTSGLDVRKLLNTEVCIGSKDQDARHALIKRSLQFQCCEHVDGQKVNDGESVELCESVLNCKEVDAIIDIIRQLQAAGQQGKLGCAFQNCKKSSGPPEVLHFGPKLGDESKKNDSHCIPKFLQAIIRWLTSCGILSPKRSPDSCLISIFDEGDFEAPNTDQGAWEKPLCVISLMEDCMMVFGHSLTTDQHGSCKGPFQVALPAGSVLLLRENFTGILQKAVPASPRRRIIIALGRAVSTCSVTSSGKNKMKHWVTGSEKQARLLLNSGLRSRPRQLPLAHMRCPFPPMQPNFAGLLLPQPTVVLPRICGKSSGGTGVFFPPCDASVPSSPWESGVLLLSSSTTPLEVATSTSRVRSTAVEKHNLDTTDMKQEGNYF